MDEISFSKTFFSIKTLHEHIVIFVLILAFIPFMFWYIGREIKRTFLKFWEMIKALKAIFCAAFINPGKSKEERIKEAMAIFEKWMGMPTRK